MIVQKGFIQIYQQQQISKGVLKMKIKELNENNNYKNLLESVTRAGSGTYNHLSKEDLARGYTNLVNK